MKKFTHKKMQLTIKIIALLLVISAITHITSVLACLFLVTGLIFKDRIVISLHNLMSRKIKLNSKLNRKG